jgi:hypothetical protein
MVEVKLYEYTAKKATATNKTAMTTTILLLTMVLTQLLVFASWLISASRRHRAAFHLGLSEQLCTGVEIWGRRGFGRMISRVWHGWTSPGNEKTWRLAIMIPVAILY